MQQKIPLHFKIGFTLLVTFLIWAHIAWDYYHEGIPTHYILQSEDMPGIPNWWGGIALPIFTWIVLSFVKRKKGENDQLLWRNVWLRGLAGVLFSVAIAIFFTLGSPMTEYLMLGLFLAAFFIKLYKPEYLLGYVLGAAYTFGAMIPILAGPILLMIVFLLYKIPRSALKLIKHFSK